jgi:cytochrome c peroxidase
MNRTVRRCALALGVLVALGACTDVPSTLAPDGRAFNRGQDKKSPLQPPATGAIVDLGELVFADENLSAGKNQSCQTCHEPAEGFAAALSGVTTRGSVVEGSVAGRFGERKPPSAAYASFSPVFTGGNNPRGGNFWDGNATGWELGTPVADQAMGPFLNPVEQALPDAACVVYRVLHNPGYYQAVTYDDVFPDDPVNVVWDPEVDTNCSDPEATGPFFSGGDGESVTRAFHNIALAVAAFESSDRVNRFNSRYDDDDLTELERQGEKLFETKAKCKQCHDNRAHYRPLFTDFEYHNLGVPKNPDNPFYHYDTDQFDPGLGGFTGQARHLGMFRTPTTRNVALGEHRTYMHNGALVSLIQVVDFYNTRDALRRCSREEILAGPTTWGSVEFGGAGCWPPPEFPGNIDTKNMGNLKLTPDEVRAVAAYMESMSDR